jgi:hypothetical protein
MATYQNVGAERKKRKTSDAVQRRLDESQALSEVLFKAFDRFSDDSTDVFDFDVVFYCIRFRKVDARHCTDVDIFVLDFDLDRLFGKVFAIVQDDLTALGNYRCVLMCNYTRLCSRLARVSADA